MGHFTLAESLGPKFGLSPEFRLTNVAEQKLHWSPADITIFCLLSGSFGLAKKWSDFRSAKQPVEVQINFGLNDRSAIQASLNDHWDQTRQRLLSRWSSISCWGLSDRWSTMNCCIVACPPAWPCSERDVPELQMHNPLKYHSLQSTRRSKPRPALFGDIRYGVASHSWLFWPI